MTTRMNASEFKAKCLAVLDEVERTGESVTILKRGRPVAVVLPAHERTGRYPQDGLRGSVEVLGDIVEPALPAGAWEATRK